MPLRVKVPLENPHQEGSEVGPTQRILEAAAAETLERIRRDRKRVPPQIQPLLAYLEEHLFDPDLDANQLKRACGVRDHSLPVHFHNALDLPPYAYIEDCRLRTACRLLRDSNLKVWQVAQLLGYSTLQVFSRAFHRWSGVRPSRFRQKERRRLDQEQAIQQSVLQRRRMPVSFTPDDPLIRLETMRRAVNGGLEKDEADALCQRLYDLYPESFQTTASSVLGSHHETFRAETARIPLVTHAEHLPLSPALPARLGVSEEAERSKAEEAWQKLKGRSWEEQWELIRDQFRFSSAALFQLLREKSREESKIDRWRGVRLAELALESLFGIDEAIGSDTLSNLQAQGWAWVGHARRLALDSQGAEKAFIRAEWCLPREGREPLVEAELYQNKAALRWFQRRYEEALKLVNHALPLFRSLAKPELIAPPLILRAAIQHDAGNPKATIPDLHEALQLIDEQNQPYTALAAHSNLAIAYALIGEYEQSIQALPKAKRLSEALDNPLSYFKLQWLEGLVYLEQNRIDLAEIQYQEARAGFIRLNESEAAATVSLDLAMIYSEQGRPAEAVHLASEAIPVFESLNIDREVLAALNMLRAAVEANELTLDVLQKLRICLDDTQSACKGPNHIQSISRSS